MYEAFGYYRIALGAAGDYAESPTAQPLVVSRLNAVNKRPEVQTTVAYAKAFVVCDSAKTPVVRDGANMIDCALFDFGDRPSSPMPMPCARSSSS